MKNKVNLKEARKDPKKTEEFLKEHDDDALGDEVQMDKTLEKLVNNKPQREIPDKTKPSK